MRSCEEVRDRLPELGTGTLDASTEARARGHLEGCATCREELEIVHLVRAAPRVAVPAGLEARSVGAAKAAMEAMEARPLRLHRESGAGRGRATRPVMPGWMLGAAAVLLLALGIPFLVERMGSPADPAPGSLGTMAAGVEEPVATLWASDDGLIAGAPALETLTDEELERLLQELGG